MLINKMFHAPKLNRHIERYCPNNVLVSILYLVFIPKNHPKCGTNKIFSHFFSRANNANGTNFNSFSEFD